MIGGYFRGPPGRLRPYVVARLTIPVANAARDVHFLVDTGADSTLVAPRDAIALALDLRTLPGGPPSVGIGGTTPTAYADATLALGDRTYGLSVRILAPANPTQRRVLGAVPSLLGRDMLSHFALFLEERTSRVLLLDPLEADALALP